MIDSQTVGYIAGLARLNLSPEETESLTTQLKAILDHVEELNGTETTGVEPTCFFTPSHDPLREDIRQPSLPRDEVLRNAPAVKNDHFAIPKVIG